MFYTFLRKVATIFGTVNQFSGYFFFFNTKEEFRKLASPMLVCPTEDDCS